MRPVLYIFIIVSLTSCKAERVFNWIKPGPAAGTNVDPITIDPANYTVYIREICKQSKSMPYQDCHNAPGSQKIEVEYLFLHKTGNRAIYLSNFSDKYERIYSKPGYETVDPAPINMWYLSKVYIGTIDKVNNVIAFTKEKGASMTIHYDTPNPNEIRFTSIDDTDKKGTVTRVTAGVLQPVPLFLQRNNFYLMMNMYEQNLANQKPEVLIAGNQMHIKKSGRNKGIYFNTGSQWDNNGYDWFWYRYTRLVTPTYP